MTVEQREAVVVVEVVEVVEVVVEDQSMCPLSTHQLSSTDKTSTVAVGHSWLTVPTTPSTPQQPHQSAVSIPSTSQTDRHRVMFLWEPTRPASWWCEGEDVIANLGWVHLCDNFTPRRMGDVEFEALKVHFDQLPQHFGTAPSTYRRVLTSTL